MYLDSHIVKKNLKLLIQMHSKKYLDPRKCFQNGCRSTPGTQHIFDNQALKVDV